MRGEEGGSIVLGCSWLYEAQSGERRKSSNPIRQSKYAACTDARS